jgi:hypothetical protein
MRLNICVFYIVRRFTIVLERATTHFFLDFLEIANEWFLKIWVHIIGRDAN